MNAAARIYKGRPEIKIALDAPSAAGGNAGEGLAGPVPPDYR